MIIAVLSRAGIWCSHLSWYKSWQWHRLRMFSLVSPRRTSLEGVHSSSDALWCLQEKFMSDSMVLCFTQTTHPWWILVWVKPRTAFQSFFFFFFSFWFSLGTNMFLQDVSGWCEEADCSEVFYSFYITAAAHVPDKKCNSHASYISLLLFSYPFSCQFRLIFKRTFHFFPKRRLCYHILCLQPHPFPIPSVHVNEKGKAKNTTLVQFSGDVKLSGKFSSWGQDRGI